MASRFSKIVTSSLAAGALALTACGGATAADDTTRNDAGDVVEGGDVGVFSLKEGDCVLNSTASEVESLQAVPCADEHDLEVYALFEMPEGDFPGTQAVDAAADAGCLSRFDAYVGLAYADSVYAYTYLTPLESGWNQIDDREIVCMLARIDGEPNVGTAENSGI